MTPPTLNILAGGFEHELVSCCFVALFVYMIARFRA